MIYLYLLLPTVLSFLSYYLVSAAVFCKLFQITSPIKRDFKDFVKVLNLEGAEIGLMSGYVMAVIILIANDLLGKGIDATNMAADLAKLGITTMSGYTMFAMAWTFINSFIEEYYWRYFVFGELKNRFSVNKAALLSALGFAGGHFVLLAVYFGLLNPLVWLMTLSIIIAGFYWAIHFNRSGSIVGPWLSHCMVDFAIFLIGSDILRKLGGGFGN